MSVARDTYNWLPYPTGKYNKTYFHFISFILPFFKLNNYYVTNKQITYCNGVSVTGLREKMSNENTRIYCGDYKRSLPQRLKVGNHLH